ncbi:MAG: hypothetical protein V2I33_18440 [Kangiellaceae bacterium]|jgi:hypothetical protein|nr:hypothetical protein [Kangiellaceae bacterium]
MAVLKLLSQANRWGKLELWSFISAFWGFSVCFWNSLEKFELEVQPIKSHCEKDLPSFLNLVVSKFTRFAAFLMRFQPAFLNQLA